MSSAAIGKGALSTVRVSRQPATSNSNSAWLSKSRHAAGVPVVSQSGPHGGCWLVDGYHLPLRGLSHAEAEALLILGDSTALPDLGLSEVTSAAGDDLPNGTRLLGSCAGRILCCQERISLLATQELAVAEGVVTLAARLSSTASARRVRIARVCDRCFAYPARRLLAHGRLFIAYDEKPTRYDKSSG